MLAAASILTACSSHTTTGTPSTTPPGTSSATNSPSASAPKVPAALPTAAILSDPCQALSATQADTIGLLTVSKPLNLAGAPGCRWTSQTSSVNSVDVSPLPENKNGLGDLYTNNDAHKYELFEPTTIDGYPAAYAELKNLRSTGLCTLWVAVTDQLTVMVEPQIGDGVNKTNPCPIAAKVGAAMIEHLKGAA
nr:DUF3558 domain-containing protein [Amycolatopsis sp.]